MCIGKPGMNDTQKLLLYHDCVLMGKNIGMMNKYSEVNYVAVKCWVYRAQTTVCQILYTI